MTPEEKRSFALKVFNWFGQNDWAWWLLLAFIAYELLGTCLLAVLEIKYGDRRKHKEYGFGLLLVWEILSKTNVNVVGLFRNLVRWFLPAWALRMLEGIGLLPADVHVPVAKPPEPEPPA